MDNSHVKSRNEAHYCCSEPICLSSFPAVILLCWPSSVAQSKLVVAVYTEYCTHSMRTRYCSVPLNVIIACCHKIHSPINFYKQAISGVFEFFDQSVYTFYIFLYHAHAPRFKTTRKKKLMEIQTIEKRQTITNSKDGTHSIIYADLCMFRCLNLIILSLHSRVGLVYFNFNSSVFINSTNYKLLNTQQSFMNFEVN